MLGFSLSLAAAGATDHVSILSDKVAMPLWDGASVTVKRYGNGRRTGSLEGPAVYRDLIEVAQASDNRILAGSHAFTGHNVYAKSYLIGAEVHVYRVTGGTLALARRSTVTGGAVDAWVQVSNKRVKTPGKKKKDAPPPQSTLVTGITYDHAFAAHNRPGVPYWFTVAAVDADGNIGPKANPVAFVPETTEGADKTRDAAGPPNRSSTVAAFTDRSAALDAPSSLRASPSAWGPNAVQLDWAEIPGAAGYIVSLSYADPATEIADQPYLELSPDPVPLQPGDLLLMSRKILSLRPENISPRAWGAKEWQGITPAIVSNKSNDPAMGTTWEWLRFDAADPAPAPHLGPWFLRRTLAPGALVEDGRYFAAGLTQNFYEILRPGRTYRWRARMRASGPVEARLTIPEPIKGTRFSLSTKWQDCVFDFSVPEMSMDDRPIKWTLAVQAGGAPVTVDYADVELFDTGLPLNVEESAITPGTFVRDHTQMNAGATTPDADTVTSYTGLGAKDTTLHTLRSICDHFKARPWIQLDWYLPREDWLDIVAYLAAPVASGHPMALKRAGQGHEAPWTDVFDRIVIEFGNETWNRGIPSFWSTRPMTDAATGEVYKTGDVYGLWCQMITDWMAESPFWPALEARAEWLLGGWARSDYGAVAARRFSRARYVGVAAYNGGWDEGSKVAREESGFFTSMLANAPVNGQASFERLIGNTRAAAEATGRRYGIDLIPAIYEAGPGYQMTGLNRAKITEEDVIVQEVVMKSRGSGTATLDNFLLSAEMGLWGANFFKLGRGGYWSSGTFDGDRFVDFPAYALPRLVTAEMAPCQVHSVLPFRPLQHSLPDRDGEMKTVNSAAVYALRSIATPSTWMLVFVNRLIDPAMLDPDDPAYQPDRRNAITTQLRTPWTRAGSLTEWANTGNFREHNRYPPGRRLTVEGEFVPDPLCVEIDFPPTAKDIPADLSLLSVEVPAGGCILWKFTDVA
jgi:hypothetical protein